MGLDAVEIVMDLEEAFGICIPDEEATQLRRFGDLIRYIQSRVNLSEGDVCATSLAFYRIRNHLMRQLLVDRSAVRPATSLEELVPANRRRDWWKDLQTSEGSRLPPLGRPVWLERTVFILIVSACISLLISWYLVVGCIAGAVLVALFTRPLATRFPAGCWTVGDLAHRLARFSTPLTRVSPEEIERRVRLIIRDQLGLADSELRDETRLF